MQPAFKGHVQTAEEAALIAQGCLMGKLTPTINRLSREERLQISDGDCFCFIEGISNLKRWTDGKKWGPSRTFNEFLVYKELNSISIDKKKETKYKKEGFQKFTISIALQGHRCHIICYRVPGTPHLKSPVDDILLSSNAPKKYEIISSRMKRNNSLEMEFEEHTDEQNCTFYEAEYFPVFPNDYCL